MKKLMLIMLLMSACTSEPKRITSTLDEINAELNKATEKTKAAQSQAINQALLPPLQINIPRSAGQPTEHRFDLAVNNAPANQVFIAIASGTPYSMLVHPDITGTISLNLKDVTLKETLDAVQELYGYDYKVQGNRIFIQPLTLQTRIFQVNYLLGQRQGRSDLRVTSGSISNTSTGATSSTGAQAAAGSAPSSTTRSVESSRVSTSADNDFWADITRSLKAIVGSEGGRNIVVNPDSGVILVRAYPMDMRNVEAFLKATKLAVERQVMLEAKIIEVQLNDQYQTGINWSFFRTDNNSRFAGGLLSPATNLTPSGQLQTLTGRTTDGSLSITSNLTSNPANPGSLIAGASVPGSLFGLAFQTSSFAALLNFLETQGTLHVLSSPRIATLNNQKAVLKVGTDEFFVTNISTSPGTTTGTTTTAPTATVTVQPFFSGIALDVTPQIDDDGMVTLHVHPSISSVVDKNKDLDLGTAGSLRLPLASSTVSETDSIVRVRDGHIVAIGGLMKHRTFRDRSQLPGVGDVPVLGEVFKNTNRGQLKSELVILVKPTVIKSETNWEQGALEVKERIQTYK